MIERTPNVIIRGGIPASIVDHDTRPRPLSGHAIRGEYVEVNWLPIIGPTATLLARRLDQFLDGPEPIDVSTLAHGLGVGRSRFWQALDRLCRFNLAGVENDGSDVTIIYLLRSWPDAPERDRGRGKEAG